MRVPSSDQRGLDPFVRNLFRDPSAFMIQSSESQRSSIWLTCLRAKTICEPFGESCGSPTLSQSRKWSTVSNVSEAVSCASTSAVIVATQTSVKLSVRQSCMESPP